MKIVIYSSEDSGVVLEDASGLRLHIKNLAAYIETLREDRAQATARAEKAERERDEARGRLRYRTDTVPQDGIYFCISRASGRPVLEYLNEGDRMKGLRAWIPLADILALISDPTPTGSGEGDRG